MFGHNVHLFFTTSMMSGAGHHLKKNDTGNKTNETESDNTTNKVIAPYSTSPPQTM